MLIQGNDLPEHIIGFEINGKLVETEIEALFAEMEFKANQFEKIRLYARVIEIDGWDTLKSFFNTMRQKFRLIGKIEKYAILTDKLWLKNVSKFSDFLTPGIDIRTFDLAEEAKAISWLQLPTIDDTVNFVREDTGFDHILGFTLDGKLSRADYEFLNTHFEQHLANHPDIRVYIEITGLEGMTLSAFFNEIKTALTYYHKILKIAILSESGQTVIKIGDFFTPGISAKHFVPTEKQEAIDWLK